MQAPDVQSARLCLTSILSALFSFITDPQLSPASPLTCAPVLDTLNVCLTPD